MKSLKKEFIMFVFQQFVLIQYSGQTKNNYPQVYLEQCKYKLKKRELVSFIDDEVDLSSNNSDNSDE